MADNPVEFQIEASFAAPDSLDFELPIEDGTIRKGIDLTDGVTLIPQFLSIRTSRAVGTPEVLTFLVTVSSSIAGKVIAESLYKWFTKTKAQRLRIDKIAVSMQDGPDRFVRVVREIIEKGPRDDVR